VRIVDERDNGTTRLLECEGFLNEVLFAAVMGGRMLDPEGLAEYSHVDSRVRSMFRYARRRDRVLASMIGSGLLCWRPRVEIAWRVKIGLCIFAEMQRHLVIDYDGPTSVGTRGLCGHRAVWDRLGVFL